MLGVVVEILKYSGFIAQCYNIFPSSATGRVRSSQDGILNTPSKQRMMLCPEDRHFPSQHCQHMSPHADSKEQPQWVTSYKPLSLHNEAFPHHSFYLSFYNRSFYPPLFQSVTQLQQNFSDCNVKMIIPVFRGVYMTLMTHRRTDCRSESACCLPSPVPMFSSREKPESMLGSGNAVFSISAFPLQLPPFPACFSLLQNSRALVFSPSYLTTAIEKLRILRPNYQLI